MLAWYCQEVLTKKSRFTETQIVSILKSADAGMRVSELFRKHGISEATYYKWKYGGMEALRMTCRRTMRLVHQPVTAIITPRKIKNRTHAPSP